LSEKRAQAARDYLVSQGVSRDSITSQGFGEGSPIESNDTAEGRQKNRRVEMVVSGAAIGTQ
jgi:outer membrane protein OmpA-like peptidoglycan-associated protein